MKPYFYDLHIHSCLSPCGDDDMTVHNILGMAMVKGLELIALTDHNSCKNCPAILKAAEGAPLTVLPGMELCTSEEFHVVCLFPSLKPAMAFDEYVYSHLPKVNNNEAIFGKQQILDEQDQVIAVEPIMLAGASTISVEQLPGLMAQFGGFAFPSHIDKNSFSIVASLGLIPPELGFTCVEVFQPNTFFARPGARLITNGYRVITNSDAHYLGDIAEPERQLELESPDFYGLVKSLRVR